MQELGRVVEEAVAPARRKLEALDGEIRRLQDQAAARQAQRPRIEAETAGLRREREALDGPITAARAAIVDIEERIRALRAELEERNATLAGLQREAESRLGMVRSSHDRLHGLDRDLERFRNEEATLVRTREEALARLREARRRAPSAWVASTYEGFLRFATEATEGERRRALHEEFELAILEDAGLRDADEKRREIRGMLETARHPGIRTLLEQQLREAEAAVEAKFPGILAAPPGPAQEDLVEAPFWYDRDEDVTRLLLPVPTGVASDPPTRVEDPRGRVLTGILWAVSRAFPGEVPGVEDHEGLVVLEWHDDRTAGLRDRIFEAALGEDRRVGLLAAPLPPELQEALQ
jgi:hypothetical protein